jgi:hypothetical protein
MSSAWKATLYRQVHNCMVHLYLVWELGCSGCGNEYCFRPPLCTLVRLNWANQLSGHERCMMTGVPDIGQGSNPRPSDLQLSSLPLDHDNRLLWLLVTYLCFHVDNIPVFPCCKNGSCSRMWILPQRLCHVNWTAQSCRHRWHSWNINME